MGYSNILALTGLPASGKTTLGRKLAKYLNYQFIDLDEYITQEKRQSIKTIFNTLGEVQFREYETKALNDILNKQPYNPGLILSLGGGTVCFNNNLTQCLNSSILIWLNTAITIIYQRLVQQSLEERPLLDKENLYHYLQNLYQERVVYYNKSHLQVNLIIDDIKNNLHTLLTNLSMTYGI